MSNSLPPRLGRLYALFPKSGADVPIDTLYVAIFPDEGAAPRDAQQRLGSYVTRLNRRLAKDKQRVAPGVGRRTLRLTKLVTR